MKNYKKPELTKYMSVHEVTNAVDSGFFSQHCSNVSEGANATYNVDDCYDAKEDAWAGGTSYLDSGYCLVE
jgi:hypothetical protein